VQAVVINLGSPESPNYQLSLQSTSLGGVALQLNDGTNNLLTTLNTGSDASYTVDGQPALPAEPISTDSSTVTIAPGLNVTLEAEGTTTVTIASSLSSVSSELSSFVNAYNAAFAEVEKNTGQNGGALVGDSSVLDMQEALTQMITYAGSSGSITSLAQLGVEFSQQGTLTFDPTVIAGLSQSQITDALTFLGDTTGGFVQYANNTLDSITDPSTGVVVTDTQSLQNQNTQDQAEIANDQAQLTLLQTNLNAQMAQANALIARLQNQNTFLQGLFQASTSNNPNASTVG
jgi:flagellar hook-associated protein 2